MTGFKRADKKEYKQCMDTMGLESGYFVGQHDGEYLDELEAK